MKYFYQLVLIFLLIYSSCSSRDSKITKVESNLFLIDSVNIADMGGYIISDFNHSKVSSSKTMLVDLFGGQVFGFENGNKIFYRLVLKELPMIGGNHQVGNIAFSIKSNNAYLYFPMTRTILEIDNNNEVAKRINLEVKDNIIADKYNSLFRYNDSASLFYLTLHRDTYNNNQFRDVPLIGAFDLNGNLVKTIESYPDNYADFTEDLSAWKYSFFDWDEQNYYAVYNRNNRVFVYDKNFSLLNEVELPDDFIATKNYKGKILNSFKKHPTKHMFCIVENDEITMDDGAKAVKVRLKWFNEETKTYGEHLLNNYMRIHQIKEDGTIVLLDRNSYEDAYFYFFQMKEII